MPPLTAPSAHIGAILWKMGVYDARILYDLYIVGEIYWHKRTRRYIAKLDFPNGVFALSQCGKNIGYVLVVRNTIEQLFNERKGTMDWFHGPAFYLDNSFLLPPVREIVRVKMVQYQKKTHRRRKRP